jgi:feruloyl-CoA synthase
MSTAPQDAAVFGETGCIVEPGDAGVSYVRCTTPLGGYPTSIVEVLRASALARPQQPLFREHDHRGLIGEVTYGEAWSTAQAIASTLHDLGACHDRPVALIGDNSIRLALIIIACHIADVPAAPISPAYSKLSQDHGKLRYVLDLLRPSVIVFDHGNDHAAALGRLEWRDARLVVLEEPPARALTWSDLISISSHASPVPAATAKILFTSGSTGLPKGVINTHAMMMSNQRALTQIWPAIAARPLRLVDWLPWNHTFGGNQIFNMAIFHGGTLTIDRGKPTPGGIAATARAIKQARPTVYFNVPRGLDTLVGLLQQDRELREALFGELTLLGYAGAALPAPIWTSLRNMAREVTGGDVPILGMWGATETGPVATAVYFHSDHPGNIGLPVPGCELKLVPADSRLEVRVRAPSVTPGYWRQPDLTAAAFDEEGFYRIGDAGKLLDPGNISAGILFDGRIAENFKLLSGTWVNVSSLRLQLIAACPELISDVVIAGENRPFPAALIFPKVDALFTDNEVRERIRAALAAHNGVAGGSSNRIGRAVILDAPPSVDHNEITDKGYLNQRAVLVSRAALVDMLYADPPDRAVIVIEK